MRWVYLSPHFDDVALSCGGLVWEQAHSGIPVSLWTVCGGDPPDGQLSPFARELHARWETGQNAPERRRLEDRNSCQRLGASQRTFSAPDCIYRRDPGSGTFMYASEEALNGELNRGDFELIRGLQEEFGRLIEKNDVLVCPMGLGNHVDHQLARRVAEGLARPLWYYADFPYVLEHWDTLETLRDSGWKSQLFAVTEEGLLAWQEAIAAHASQINTFWPGCEEMAQSIADYLHKVGGICLWRAE